MFQRGAQMTTDGGRGSLVTEHRCLTLRAIATPNPVSIEGATGFDAREQTLGLEIAGLVFIQLL